MQKRLLTSDAENQVTLTGLMLNSHKAHYLFLEGILCREIKEKIANYITIGKPLFVYPNVTSSLKCLLFNIVIDFDLISTPSLKMSSLYFCSRPHLSAFSPESLNLPIWGYYGRWKSLMTKVCAVLFHSIFYSTTCNLLWKLVNFFGKEITNNSLGQRQRWLYL